MKNYTITVNGNVYEVSVEENHGSVEQAQTLSAAPATSIVAAPKVAPIAAAPKTTPNVAPAVESVVEIPKAPAATGLAGLVKISAPMPGKILSVKVSAGQEVKKGDVIVILEAMKMENEIVAPQDGVVATVNISSGQSVESGVTLATLN